ncbi:PKD domain-containing protein [Kitasatospora sp. NBC_00240]|uniref:PKD domain-containing protein n=1 Tax=Kitasatospora sp. NBC_00240 TaxID=2903567 RepID=UPI0022537D5D|nr:PKD domain-containing protein [Kitasatospora sp. NBC_00240]MCX5212898.1 PKD domain-containing protein [Kitasatospora sp. NBC_00240]
MRKVHSATVAVLAATAAVAVGFPVPAVAADQGGTLPTQLNIWRDGYQGPVTNAPTILASQQTTSGATIVENVFDFGDGTAPEHSPYYSTRHTYAAPGRYTVTLTSRDAAGNTGSASQVVTVGSVFVPAAPARLLDTRAGTGAARAKVGPDGVVTVTVAGRGGIPASGVTAVVLNLTATNPTDATFVTAYASGAGRPTASNLNTAPGQTVPNQVTVPVGPDGRISLYNHVGTVDLIADLEGYYAPTSVDPAAGTTIALGDARRVLDTRNGTGAAQARIHGGGVLTIRPTDLLSSTPPAGRSAAVLNLTVTDPTGTGFVAAYPGGSARPDTSTLNFTPGRTSSSLVTVPLGPDGTVNLFNSAGDSDLVADLQGFVATNSYPWGSTGYFTPVAPTRLLDTRNGTGGEPARLTPGAWRTLKVAGVGAIPADVRAVLVNVTATGTVGSGHVRVSYPGMMTRDTSNLNYQEGQTVANATLVPVGSDGCILLDNSYGGSLDAVVDLQGYTTD